MTSAPPWGRTVPGNRWDLLDGQWPAEPPRVSVIVVHHRQQAQLDRTLAALGRQTHPAERLEVLVVDDGSPGAPAVPDTVRLLRQPDRGFRAGAARSLGATHAHGDVLCFLDADTVPEPDYVRQLTRLPALAPEAVTVGRRGHADLSGVARDALVEAAAPAVALPAPEWLTRGYAESGDLLRADDRSYRFVISAVLACSRWFFATVGPFDPEFTAYGGEDWEWAHRAWLAGAILAHVPNAVAWHDGPDWAGRGAAERSAKNAETLRLAELVAVPGSRPSALRGSISDVVVHVPAAGSPAAAFVCADSVLAALPEATVVTPDAHVLPGDARVAAVVPGATGARVVVHLPRPVRVRGGELRAAVDRIGADGLGSITLIDGAGEALALVQARRALLRAQRWGDDTLFPAEREQARGLEPIADEPDLEAYLGGWG